MATITMHQLHQPQSHCRRNSRAAQSLWIGLELNELGQPKSRGMQPEYLPTPDEIAAACQEIQQEWTPEERRRRAGGVLPSELERATAVA